MEKNMIETEIILDKTNPEVEKEQGIDSKIVKPYNPKDVDISVKQLSLDNIIKRIKHDEIDFFTDFQRKEDLWEPGNQSRLIESILIRFPLPAFYFDATNDNKWVIVDGLQRLCSIRNFVVNKNLILTGLEYLEKFEDKSYDELPRELQRRIEEANITAYLINPGTPPEVKYNIFKRINTAGLILEPQEIRHAINYGAPAKFIEELSQMEEFKKATCYSIRSERMQDRDFVTRFVSFYINSYEEYEPSLDDFLNKGMQNIRRLADLEKDSLKTDFKKAMILSTEIFGDDAFRKRFDEEHNRKPINKALFDTISVNFSKLPFQDANKLKLKKNQFKKKFIDLMNEKEFLDSITSATGDKNNVATRFKKFGEVIKEVLNDN